MNAAATGEKAPQILFRKGDDTLVIALPELLDYDVVETVLMKTPIKPPEPTIFIFPGVILKARGEAFYIPVAELTLFEGSGMTGENAVRFDSGGSSHSIPDAELREYTQRAEVRARDPLQESGPVTVFPGSLLRDRDGGLYYLPPGVFGTFTSFAEALRGA